MRSVMFQTRIQVFYCATYAPAFMVFYCAICAPAFSCCMSCCCPGYFAVRFPHRSTSEESTGFLLTTAGFSLPLGLTRGIKRPSTLPGHRDRGQPRRPLESAQLFISPMSYLPVNAVSTPSDVNIGHQYHPTPSPHSTYHLHYYN